MAHNFSIKNVSDSHAEVSIYSSIGANWWDDSVDAATFKKEVDALDVDNITLRLNSPGGDVFDGVAIYNTLREHKARILVKVDALAASIASIIMLAGDEIEMAENAQVMIHNPMICTCGESEDLRKSAELMDKIKSDVLIKTYTSRTNLTEEQAADLMDAETWFSAAEAMEHGFITSVTTAGKVQNKFNLSNFKNTPKALLKVEEVENTAEVQTPAVETNEVCMDMYNRRLAMLKM